MCPAIKQQKKKKPRAYLTNKSLLEQVVFSRELGKMSDGLAKMLILLVERFSKKPKYAGYSFIKDMRGFAISELLRSWLAFDPKRSEKPNPFAFYTQCIKNSFRQFLNKEKKQRRIRDKLLVYSGLTPSFSYQEEMSKQKENDEEDWNQQNSDMELEPTKNKDMFTY